MRIHRRTNPAERRSLMPRMTIPLSEERQRAVKEAAARRGTTITALIDESLGQCWLPVIDVCERRSRHCIQRRLRPSLPPVWPDCACKRLSLQFDQGAEYHGPYETGILTRKA